ncbi:hypothetical protein FS749_012759 [Ceratobasidium sp. UAMH 11750]|nr:hypothetical protein FS749_012759 [Ceratobasidium sp. UAMH 11750]
MISSSFHWSLSDPTNQDYCIRLLDLGFVHMDPGQAHSGVSTERSNVGQHAKQHAVNFRMNPRNSYINLPEQSNTKMELCQLRLYRFDGRQRLRINDILGDFLEKLNSARAAALFRQLIAPSVVKLKIGAQVMSLQHNKRREEIVNGPVGGVIEFITPAAARSLPDVAIINQFEGKYKEPAKEKPTSRWKARHESVRELQRRMVYEAILWLLVLFENGLKVMVGPVEFTSETTTGVGQARRSQVSLILARALTVSKI